MNLELDNRIIEDEAKLKSDFDRDGFVALKGFLTATEVAELREEVARYLLEVAPKLPAADVFSAVRGDSAKISQLIRMHEHDDYFRQLIVSERFSRVAAILLGDAVVSKNMQWFNKPPVVGEATPPHQDGYYFMLEPSEAVTMWLALDEVDEANGCVRYIPNSHREPMRKHGRNETLGFSQSVTNYGEADFAREIPMIASPGDLLVHHAMTVHRADANPTERTRKAMGLIYYAKRATEDAERQQQYQVKLRQELAAAGKI